MRVESGRLRHPLRKCRRSRSVVREGHAIKCRGVDALEVLMLLEYAVGGAVEVGGSRVRNYRSSRGLLLLLVVVVEISGRRR